MSFGFLEGDDRYGLLDAGREHHDRDWSSIAGGLQGAGGGPVIGAGGLLDDANGALNELFILGPNIHHEISIDVTEARHGPRRDHVEDHLVRRAGLHAGGSGEDFWADFGDDGEIGGALKGRVAVAGEGDGVSSAATGVFDGRDCERSTPAGGDAEDDIVLAGLPLLDFGEGEIRIVFAGFGGGAESFGTTGHDELHGAGIGIEGRWNLGGVESSQAAAGSSADVDEASTVAETVGNDLDGAGNLWKRALDGGGNGCVFRIDNADDFERRHLIELRGGGENLLGRKLVKVGFRGAGSGQVLPFRSGLDIDGE